MFKLEFDIPVSSKKISQKDSLFLVGSCFSDIIGDQLQRSKFRVLSNPLGTVYNPISIFKALRGSIDQDNVIESHGVWYHWDAHGGVSGLSKEQVTTEVQKRQANAQLVLSKAKKLIITLGTATVYRLLESGEVVANCHKVDARRFKKELLSAEEIVSDWHKTHKTLLDINPGIEVIFTVSPVRHVRDGLIENNLSKAILLQAAHEIVGSDENNSYFPSYEILIDELRDYRFFSSDLIHPSVEAIKYIWEKFMHCYFDKETQDFVAEWGKILAALSHRPFQPKSEAHQLFLKNTINKLEHYKNSVDVSKELEALHNQLI